MSPDFTRLIDLASERLGGEVLLANDDFFAPKENLIKASKPVWREGEYTDRGKWMDGWETRRRREPGHDWCVLRLGRPGVIRGVVVDTAYFTGNYPESCSLEACVTELQADPEQLAAQADWIEILPRSPLSGNAENPFPIEATQRFTHLRLNIFPDGGVARLRVHGEPVADWDALLRGGGDIDLAAAEHGGRVVRCSDEHYGNPQNMLLPGPSLGMHDGWETKRRRGEGNEWAVIRLAARGEVRRVVLDTSHFKGNAPGWCSVDACDAGGETVPPEDGEWRELLPRRALRPHEIHEFDDPGDVGPATHLRLNIYPDGGVARFRAFGVPEIGRLG